MRLRRVGHMVFASCRHYGINATANGIFFTIPDGFRPSASCYVYGYISIDAIQRPVMALVETNGNVTIGYSSSKTTDQVGFDGCWPVL